MTTLNSIIRSLEKHNNSSSPMLRMSTTGCKIIKDANGRATISITNNKDMDFIGQHLYRGILFSPIMKLICFPFFTRKRCTYDAFIKEIRVDDEDEDDEEATPSCTFDVYPMCNGTLIDLYCDNKIWKVHTTRSINVLDTMWRVIETPSITRVFRDMLNEAVDNFDEFVTKLDKNCTYSYVFTHKDIHLGVGGIHPYLTFLRKVYNRTLKSEYTSEVDQGEHVYSQKAIPKEIYQDIDNYQSHFPWGLVAIPNILSASDIRSSSVRALTWHTPEYKSVEQFYEGRNKFNVNNAIRPHWIAIIKAIIFSILTKSHMDSRIPKLEKLATKCLNLFENSRTTESKIQCTGIDGDFYALCKPYIKAILDELEPISDTNPSVLTLIDTVELTSTMIYNIAIKREYITSE